MPSFALRFAVFLVGIFAFLQVYAIQAILPVLQQKFLATPTQMGLTVAMTVLAIALMSPVMGMISDMYGRKRFIVGAMAFLALPTYLLGFSETLASFNAWRFLQGLCVPLMTVVVLAYIGEEFPKAIGSLTATYVAGTVLGGFLGRFVLGHLSPLIGYQSTFVLMAVATLIGAAWLFIILPMPLNFQHSTGLRQGLSALCEHLRNHSLLLACWLGGCVLFSLVGCFTFINLHLAAKPYHLTTAMLGNIFTVYLIGVLITPLSGQLLKRLGTKLVMTLAIALSVVGMLTTLAVSFWAIIMGLTVMSVGVFITQTATISYTNQALTHDKSLGLGLYYMAYYAGGSIGGLACGIAYGTFGWGGVVGLIVAVQAVGLGVVRFLH